MYRSVIGTLVLFLVAVGSLPALAEQTSQTPVPGISAQKPETGPSVEIQGGYMVPYVHRIPGSDVHFEMIPIPGGHFLLGSPEDEQGREENEGPQVKVTIDPFWMGKTEVTWAEYDEFMNLYEVFKDFEARGIRPVGQDNLVDAITTPTPLYDPEHTYEYGKSPEKPAVTMTQYAAKQYTKWLSGITEAQYRLPTEAEWEYACRAGSATAYFFGDDAGELEDYAWFFDNADDGPQAVGTKKPNPYGLYDMHGNVAEWTVDAFTVDGYSQQTQQGLTGVSSAKWPNKPFPCTLRGGCWEFDAAQLRCAARLGSDDPEWKEYDPNYPKSPWWFTTDPARGVGFRMVRSLRPLDRETINKFWEAVTEGEKSDIESRLTEGRGGLGLVDKNLPEAIQQWKAAQ